MSNMFDPPLQIPMPIKPTPVQLRPSDNRISASEDPAEKPYPLMSFSCEPMDELRNILFAQPQQQPQPQPQQPSLSTSSSCLCWGMNKQSQQPQPQPQLSRYKPPLNISIRASVDGLPVATPAGGPTDAPSYPQPLSVSSSGGFLGDSTSCLECSGEAPSAMFEFDLPQMPAVSPTPFSAADAAMTFVEPTTAPERSDNPLARNEGFLSDYRAVLPPRAVQAPNKGPSDESGAELGLLSLSL